MSVRYEKRVSAFSTRLQTFALVNVSNLDFISFFDNAYPLFVQKISQLLETQRLIVIYADFDADYIKETDWRNGADINTCTMTLHVTCKTELIDCDTDIYLWYENYIKNVVIARAEAFEALGSGWTLAAITELSVNCNRYDGFRGSSYIKLPSTIRNKGAIINVQNRDNECFRWAILSAMHEPEQHKYRVSKYEAYRNDLNFYQLEFPMDVSKIKRFEQLNPAISVNVYIIDDSDGDSKS